MKTNLLKTRIVCGVLTAVALTVISTDSEGAESEVPKIQGLELQPVAAQVRRVIEALDVLGAPLSSREREKIAAASHENDQEKGLGEIQAVFDPHCLAVITINPEMRVKANTGPVRRDLVEGGWRTFLLKIVNDAGSTSELRIFSPNAQSVHNSEWKSTPSDRFLRKRNGGKTDESENQLWLDLEGFDRQPLNKELSGLKLEYRIVSLYSRDAGEREAKLMFDIGQGTQDLGFRSERDFLFHCVPAREVVFKVLDENGRGTTGMFLIRDREGRIYPSQAKRLAPDFAFHPQIYRSDREKVRLSDGQYTIECGRGPEYLVEKRAFEINDTKQTLEFKLKRWIDPSKSGWWSGDHHIHAAGCAHYTVPTEGVLASDMYRHCQGEDLKVGCNLTWGPCFDFQKQFFTGKDDSISKYPYLLHYDVEVSGFGSHQSGHLVLLQLKDQIYPGGTSDKHWPTLGLNTLRWAKKQGAICGPAHSGWGLEVETSDLPNYIVPPYSGIGADEYIVDVTHDVPNEKNELVPAVDFLSMVDTPYVWELNMWYNTLNVGFRTRISGETDFPCIYGERVGLGRSYVKLGGKLSYQKWCEGIRAGRNYVSDGHSHLMDFKVNDVAMGERGSELKLKNPATVKVQAEVAAFLDEVPQRLVKAKPYSEKPYWDIERARISGTREVPVELIVNGNPVARKNFTADGARREVAFETHIEKSSWVALRILGSSHTNPIFVLVDQKPIRASKRSANWCLSGVDKCWEQKKRFIKQDEMEQAKLDYQHARDVYQTRLRECENSEANR